MSKKILITGMNREQCVENYFLTKELKILNSHYSLIRCLRDMGFEVEQRPVIIGEDLNHYDDVIIYLHSPQGYCQNLYDGLYAIVARPDAILAFDDWQVDQIVLGFTEFKKNLLNTEKFNPFRQYLMDLYTGPSDIEIIKQHRHTYIHACDIVLSRTNRLLVCAFAGGDLSFLGINWNIERMFQYNPNPYNMNRRPDNNYGVENDISSFFDDHEITPEDKQRAWVFSSLIQNKTKKWLKSQKIAWDLKIYGGRRGVNKSKRIIEPEMCRIYNSNWGCLMPAYYHAGSGWWRSRVQQVVDVGSILYCEDKEGAIYGEAFTKMSVSEIENMSIGELTKMAKYQYECLYDNHPLDKSVQRQELIRVLESK